MATLNRLRLQYSLRSLFVFMLVASIGMSWFGAKCRAAREQRDAVAAIRALGAWVSYDYTGRRIHYWRLPPLAAGWPAPPVSPVPAWARRLLGEDFFANVDEVGPVYPILSVPPYGYQHSPINDACLEQIGKLPRLVLLDLGCSRVSDAGLRHLRGLTCLRYLNLERNRDVTDGALAEIGTLTHLEVLDLDGTGVTDEGLEQITGLRDLRYLGVAAPGVSERGVMRLRRALPHCEIVWRFPGLRWGLPGPSQDNSEAGPNAK
jgi:hypothetical protein